VEELPVPRPQLTATALDPDVIPADVRDLLGALWNAGWAAYVVGGSLRDVLLGRRPKDWDLATDARPEDTQALFPGSVYENAFGTVAVRRSGAEYEITTFRREHEYADFRRPHRLEFGDSIEEDLGRRDFTVNAIAWGRTTIEPEAEPHLVDPYAGRADIDARRLRAVGDPLVRFEEDALRMIRAVRLAAALGFEIESGTLAAIRDRAPLAAHLSAERISAELTRLLEAPRPSIGLRLMAETGLLAVILPELDAQRGVRQNKIPGDDLWAHTLRSVDAAPADRPTVRLAALLHDIGKPSTAADGRFVGHDRVGARMARAVLARLRYGKSEQDRVAFLVDQHMFTYEQAWTDAAVRRFIAKVGVRALEDLFELREADNVGSGAPRDAGWLPELRRRVTEQLEADVALTLSDLAVNGDDLKAELGIAPGPELGRMLDDLLDRVLVDSELNDRPTLLMLARGMLAERAS
jgi:poly(A) polymerase/tRNA nucleotidyltransferase (CCA-adding enzyme)